MQTQTQTQAASRHCGPRNAKRLKAPDGPDGKTPTSEAVAKETPATPGLSPSRFGGDAASEGSSLTSLARRRWAGGKKKKRKGRAVFLRICVCVCVCKSCRYSSRDVPLLQLCGCRCVCVGGAENNMFCCELNRAKDRQIRRYRRGGSLCERESYRFQFWRSVRAKPHHPPHPPNNPPRPPEGNRC